MFYTYTKLIRGTALAYNICADLQEKARKNRDSDSILRYARELDEHQNNINRYKLARILHGDALLIARRY